MTKIIKDYKTFSYSLEEFEGYSHRFIYSYYDTINNKFSRIEMFTNNENKELVEELIKTILIIKFPRFQKYEHKFEYFGTKKEDEINKTFIDLIFKK